MTSAYDEVADRLWEKTETDWHVMVSYTLTEPVCAIVTMTSDDDALPKLEGFIGNGDVNDSIRLAGEHMLAKLNAQ